MDSVTIHAYAKINLGLDVLGKRSNGYHDVKMIMQTVNLYDRLIITKREDCSIEVTTNLSFLPTNSDNLVYRAASLMMEVGKLTQGVSIQLNKRIPVAAGLAGGSSDAAACLRGMNALFDLGYSEEKLMEFGLSLGADIPYCLMGKTALAEGIGEKLTRLEDAPDCFVLLVKPAFSVSTQYVYQNLKPVCDHPDIDGVIEAIQRKDCREMAHKIENVLETVTMERYPVLKQYKEKMMQLGAMNALMSGSGPTIFGLFEDKETVKRAKESFLALPEKKQVYITEFYHEIPTIKSNQ